MDKEITENVEETKLYKMLVCMMVIEAEKEKNAQWQSFADELRYKNRFTIKHTIIDEIHECKTKTVTTHSKDAVLYRARVFNKNYFDRFAKYYLQESGFSQSDITKILKEWTSEQKIVPVMSDILSDSDYSATSRLQKLKTNGNEMSSSKGGTRKNPVHLRLTMSEMAELILTIFGICICRKTSLLQCMR